MFIGFNCAGSASIDCRNKPEVCKNYVEGDTFDRSEFESVLETAGIGFWVNWLDIQTINKTYFEKKYRAAGAQNQKDLCIENNRMYIESPSL